MNGCLGKLLFLITLLTLMFLGYPHFKKLLSDQTQDRLHQMETSGRIVGKIIRSIGGKEIDEKKKEF